MSRRDLYSRITDDENPDIVERGRRRWNKYWEHDIWQPFDIDESNRQVAATNKALYDYAYGFVPSAPKLPTWEQSNKFLKESEGVAGAIGELGGLALEKWAGAPIGTGEALGKLFRGTNKVAEALTKEEPEAKHLLNAFDPFFRAANRGVRTFSSVGQPQTPARENKKRKIGRRTRKPGANRPTSKRNAKHKKTMTKKRARENTEHAVKHFGKPLRPAQFYRDNGLPVPAGAQ